MADTVVINIRTRGGRQAAREAQLASRGIAGIGRAATTAGAGLRSIGRDASGVASRGLGMLRTQAQYTGLAIGALGVYAVKSGIEFNATMEQNQVAFANFLGSSRAARQELAFLYKTAANTPFQTTDITKAARQLLAFGFNAKQANSYLLSIGDAISGAGLGAESIDQMVRAIGQIRGKGTLQAEELNQLGELGVLDRGKFAKNLGITTAQLADAGNQGISARKALRALQKTLDDTFHGSSAKQAKTFNGQLSTLRDNLNMTLGTLTEPAFNALKDNVLPALGDATKRVNAIFGRDDIDLAQKLTLSKRVLRAKLGPLADEFLDEVRRMHIGQHLEDAFEAAVPRIADAAGRAAPKIAGALVRGFLDAGPYGKMFALGYLLKKIGAFALLGRAAAYRFGAGYRSVPPPIGTGVPVPGGPGGKGGRLGKLGRLGSRVLPFARVAGPTAAFVYGTGVLNPDSAGWDTNSERAHLDNLQRKGMTGFTNAQMRAYDRRNGALRAQQPVRPGRGMVVHTSVQLDRKEIAKAIHRFDDDRKARK